MAFRTEKAACAAVIATLCASLAQAAEFRYQAVHDHLRKSGRGALVIGENGVAFDEEAARPGKHPHVWRWNYDDIQQLKLSLRTLEVLTYQDNKWKLGADRVYRFELPGDATFSDAYPFLKDRLDQRFVAALAAQGPRPLWELPVKHQLRRGGSQGVLSFSRDAVVYSTLRRGESRTWRWKDIDNISSSGPFQLTITTFERAWSHYGGRKDFNFQLKRPLDEARYNQVWQRVNQARGLRVLTSYQERNGSK